LANAIFDGYLSGASAVRRFFSGHFADPAARRAAVARALERPIAKDVLCGIADQNAELKMSAARERNLELLARGAACVVTGQQVGLFLGPLYTVYKAASAVKLAERLAEESGRPVVPVFWLQTEDHDLAEIASCRVPCARGEPLHLSLEASRENRISIAHLLLPDAISSLYAMLATELTSLPHAQETLDLIERHYRPGARWSAAFAGMLGELFESLILIDPRDRSFSRVARSVHGTAIREAEPIARALVERARELERGGFSAQVQVRPEIPLSFHHPKGADGPRVRLEPGALTFDERELAYSTGALLRPILQDSLLPTAAYVGGPAEVAYFAQLDPLYAAYGLPPPLIAPRAQVRIVEEKIRRALARLSFSADDASLPEDVLLARVQPTDPTADQLAVSLLEPFARELARITSEEPSLTRAAEKTLGHVKRSISTLMDKYRRTQLRRDRSIVEDVERVKSALMPQDTPQERFYSLPYFLARYGRSFLYTVYAAIDPLDPKLKDVSP
jgi:bacillithiol biosynthesis cysteine-adding enzyme BshC